MKQYKMLRPPRIDDSIQLKMGIKTVTKQSPQSWNKPPRIQPYLSENWTQISKVWKIQLLLDLNLWRTSHFYHPFQTSTSGKKGPSPKVLSFQLLPRPLEVGDDHIPRRQLRHLRGVNSPSKGRVSPGGPRWNLSFLGEPCPRMKTIRS